MSVTSLRQALTPDKLHVEIRTRQSPDFLEQLRGDLPIQPLLNCVASLYSSLRVSVLKVLCGRVEMLRRRVEPNSRQRLKGTSTVQRLFQKT